MADQTVARRGPGRPRKVDHQAEQPVHCLCPAGVCYLKSDLGIATAEFPGIKAADCRDEQARLARHPDEKARIAAMAQNCPLRLQCGLLQGPEHCGDCISILVAAGERVDLDAAEETDADIIEGRAKGKFRGFTIEERALVADGLAKVKRWWIAPDGTGDERRALAAVVDLVEAIAKKVFEK